jgi:cytidyltransferase-like protein
MIIKTIEALREIRRKYNNKKIVFCSGSFDLVHTGHILFLEDCKSKGDILVVAVGNDKMLRILKGENRPIMNEYVRLKIIDSLKPVDYCFLDTFSNSSKENPNGVLNFTFENLKPDVYVINEDAFDIPYRENLCKNFNVKMIISKRTSPEEFENISSSKIIKKILSSG